MSRWSHCLRHEAGFLKNKVKEDPLSQDNMVHKFKLYTLIHRQLIGAAPSFSGSLFA